MLSPSQMHEEFREAVRAHLRETGADKTTFGLEALGDPNFVNDLLEESRVCRPETMERVLAFMRGEIPAKKKGRAA